VRATCSHLRGRSDGEAFDATQTAKKKRRSEKRQGDGAGAGSGVDEEGPGLEKHNQFLWAKRMGQQNEPRWGLFKQGGSAGPAFLKLLEQLEQDGILERQYGDVPDNLGGVSGWIVKEGRMDEWKTRRQVSAAFFSLRGGRIIRKSVRVGGRIGGRLGGRVGCRGWGVGEAWKSGGRVGLTTGGRQQWFMEGKEGKEYKPNSLYQIMRRLGYFPTMRSSRAGRVLRSAGALPAALD